MLKRVKKWLGIEGVKLELEIPETVSKYDKTIPGRIRLYSLEDQEVTQIQIYLIERYARGRKKESKLVDEYRLGELQIKKSIKVPANSTVELTFELPFSLVNSEMDDWGSKNIINGGILKALKWAEGVRSKYRLEAEAQVKGVALNPFDKKDVNVS